MILSFFLVCQILLLCKIHAAAVINIESSNFLASINDPSKPAWLLVYYDPQCVHSKRFLNEVDDVSSVVNDKFMTIGKIDCTKEKELCLENIQSYPTLKLYRDGEFQDYDGARDRDSLLSFYQHVTGAPVTNMIHHEDFFQSDDISNDVSFIMYSYGPSIPACKSSFGSVAKRFQSSHASFRALEKNLDNDEWIKSISGKTSGDVLLRMEIDLPSDSNTATVYNGNDCTVESLTHFVETNLQTVVPEFTEKTINTLIGTEKLIALAVVDPKHDDTKEFLSSLRKWVSTTLPSWEKEFAFAWMNGPEFDFILAKYEVSFTGKPGFFVVEVPSENYWNFQEEDDSSFLSTDSIDRFLRKIKKREILPNEIAGSNNNSGNDFIKYMPEMIQNQSEFYQNHPWVRNFFICMGVLNVIFMYSMSLPHEHKFARFMETHVGQRLDKLINLIADSEGDSAKEKNE